MVKKKLKLRVVWQKRHWQALDYPIKINREDLFFRRKNAEDNWGIRACLKLKADCNRELQSLLPFFPGTASPAPNSKGLFRLPLNMSGSPF